MSTATQKEAPSFLAPGGVEAEINGESFRFYAISLKAIFEAKTVFKPIITALAALQIAPPLARVKERIRSGDDMKEVFEASTPELAKIGAASREKAVADLVDALLDPKNVASLRAVIVDSLRDVYPRGAKLTKEQERAFEDLDLPTAIEFVKAIVSANRQALADLFVPFKEGVTGLGTVTPEGNPATRSSS